MSEKYKNTSICLELIVITISYPYQTDYDSFGGGGGDVYPHFQKMAIIAILWHTIGKVYLLDK